MAIPKLIGKMIHTEQLNILSCPNIAEVKRNFKDTCSIFGTISLKPLQRPFAKRGSTHRSRNCNRKVGDSSILSVSHYYFPLVEN